MRYLPKKTTGRVGEPTLVPDKQSVEVEVGPFLCFPPVMFLTLVYVFVHCARGYCLGNGLKEHGTPADVDVWLAKEGREL